MGRAPADHRTTTTEEPTMTDLTAATPAAVATAATLYPRVMLTVHTPDCLLGTYASAAENARDMPADADLPPVTHRLLLDWALGYLLDGTASCTCPTAVRAAAVTDLDTGERDAYRAGDDATAQVLAGIRHAVETTLGGIHLGDTLTWWGANGHAWEGPVTGFWHDGTPRAAQWNAVHADSCDCSSWEGADQSIPDW